MPVIRNAVACAAWLSFAWVCPISPAHAQQSSSVFSDVIRSAWYDVNSLLQAAAKKMPEEHYSFRPVKQAKSFAEIVAHLSGEHYAICGAVTGRANFPTGLEKLAAKDALVTVLQDSIAVCDLAYGLLTDENASFTYVVFNTAGTRLSLLTATIAHDNEHFGNLATYMRLNDVTPPGVGQ